MIFRVYDRRLLFNFLIALSALKSPSDSLPKGETMAIFRP